MADLGCWDNLLEQPKVEGLLAEIEEDTRENVVVAHVEVVGAAAAETVEGACFGLLRCHD